MTSRFFRRTQPPVPPPTFLDTFSDRLPSRNKGLAFAASIRTEWRDDLLNTDKPPSPRTAARVIREIMQEVSQKSSVLRARAAEDDIEASLQNKLPLVIDGIEVLRVEVRLTVDQETIDSAMRLERLLHEQELDELARRQAKGRADFLREIILRDPASARIYTMFELSPRIGGPSPDIDINQLIKRVNEWHPESRWIVVAQILNDFLEGLSEGGRKDLLNIVQHAISILGTSEQSSRLANIAETPDFPSLNL